MNLAEWNAQQQAKWAEQEQYRKEEAYRSLQEGAQNAMGLAKAQQIRNVPSESDLREKALHMAIDYHRSIPGDVEATAAKFLAFLKGGADV